MNFFQQQDRARQQSRKLLGLFLLAVVAVVIAVNVAVILLLGFMPEEAGNLTGQPGLFTANAGLIGLTTLATLMLIGIGSAWKIHSLRSQGSAIAEALGGTKVPVNCSDFKLKRLRNIVEEVSLASGVTVPAIYVIESEQGINAFAAGFNTEDAAVAVTRGCLDSLNRDELQGVIAHEFSHILNGDMRLNLRLMGWLHGILLIGLLGELLLRGGFWGGATRSSRDRDGGGAGAIMVLGIALLAIGFIGVFFARMIKAAVSRQREFLADASAVQFTRYPQGISGALQKIAVHASGSHLEKPRAEQISHMLFASGLSARLLATHPPLDERIRAIDPSWTKSRLEKVRAELLQGETIPEAPPTDAATTPGAAGFAGAAQPPAPAGDTRTGAPPPDLHQQSGDNQAQVASGWVDAIGEPSLAALAWARKIREQLPVDLVDAAHDHERCQWLLFALLASDDTQGRKRLSSLPDSFVPDDADKLWHSIRRLCAFQRLPLMEIILASLGELSHARRQQLLDLSHSLVKADGTVSLFQYAATRLFAKSVRERQRKTSGQTAGSKRLYTLRKEISWLFSLVSHMAHDDHQQARSAWLSVIHRLFGQHTPDMPKVAEHWQPDMDRVLIALDRLRADDKRILIESLVELSSHDGKITLAESELLRLLAGLLHVPLPPLVAVQESAG